MFDKVTSQEFNSKMSNVRARLDLLEHIERNSNRNDRIDTILEILEEAGILQEVKDTDDSVVEIGDAIYKIKKVK